MGNLGVGTSDGARAEVDRPGIDRRTLIRRAAVTGAVAWTAPIIIGSLTSPAGAITGVTGCSIIRYHFSNSPNDACSFQGSAGAGGCPQIEDPFLTLPTCNPLNAPVPISAIDQVCLSEPVVCNNSQDVLTFTIDSNCSCEFAQASAERYGSVCTNYTIAFPDNQHLVFTKTGTDHWQDLYIWVRCE